MTNEENTKEQELVETVLLSDILDAAEAIEDPKQIIMKIDIELFECRAFLGSSSLLDIGCVMKPIFTLRKMKTMTLTLKPSTNLFNQSNLIYRYECAFCKEAYLGYTTRHLGVRAEEHTRTTSSIWKHHQECEGIFDQNGFTCLYKTNKNRIFLETVEAIFIHYKKSKLNDKDEFRSR